jgi:hypothetical protein
LFGRELRAQLVLVRRIAQQAGVIADEERHFVPKFLELAQLAHGDGVPDMEIAGARVHAQIHAQRPAFGQADAQLGSHILRELFVAVFGSLHEQGNLFVQGHVQRHGCCIHAGDYKIELLR